jgi:hypothetical protein
VRDEKFFGNFLSAVLVKTSERKLVDKFKGCVNEIKNLRHSESMRATARLSAPSSNRDDRVRTAGNRPVRPIRGLDIKSFPELEIGDGDPAHWSYMSANDRSDPRWAGTTCTGWRLAVQAAIRSRGPEAQEMP